MYGILSPLMLIAGQGLVNNTGLGINRQLLINILEYKSIGVVAASAEVEANCTQVNLSNFQTFTANSFPGMNNTMPAGAGFGSATNRLTNEIPPHANNILGNGDLSKFVVQMYTVMAYIASSGTFIDAAITSKSQLELTFSNMDELTTGSISSISLATREFGADLINTGLLIDLDKLNTYGTPQSLIAKLSSRGLLLYISEELTKAGVNPSALASKISGLENNQTLPLLIQKKCYDAFKTVTGTKLETIKSVLRINIQNGIRTLADLMDTQKIFPLSYRTLTSPHKTGYKKIYVGANAVNDLFKDLGKEYYGVLPTGLADANAAMRYALQQIKNVRNLRSEQLGEAVQKIQTNYGLDLINSLDKPVPDSVYSYYTSAFATGSGSNGRYYLSDGIGTPAGITHNDAYTALINIVGGMDTDGKFSTLYGSVNKPFNVMIDFCNDVYGTPDEGDVGMGIPPSYATIPGGYPGAGSYDNYQDGFDAILADTITIFNTIVNNNASDVSAANEQTDAIVNQIETELRVLQEAGVVFADTPSNKQSILNMVQNLHTYANQNEYRGPAELLEKMADQTTQAGQALVGALREGRNISALNTIGVGMDNVPDTPTDPADGTGEFTEAIYSVDEAIANITTD